MATISELNVKLGLLTGAFQKSLRGVERDLRQSSGRLSRLGNDMALSISAPLAGIGYAALRSTGEMESLRLAIETTMKDAGYTIEQARKELDDLRKAALAPGLDFEQAVKASIRLQNVGKSAEDARKTIKETANTISLAGGTAEDLDGVTIQFAQMISKGKVLSQDLRIIQERMPKISLLMKEAFGTSNAENLQEMGITGHQFVDEMTKRMGGLSRVSGGLANSFVNFSSAIRQSLGVLGEEIDKTFDVRGNLEKFSGWVSGIVEGFKGLGDGTKKFIVTSAGILVIFAPLVKVLGAVQGLAAQTISIFSSMVGVFKNVAGAVLKAAAAFQAMDMKTKLTTIGLIAAAVAGLVLAFHHFSKELSTAEKITANLTEVNLSAQKSMIEERIEAERLTNILKDNTAGYDAKKKALERLREISPEYFDGLEIEKSGVEDITKAYNLYVGGLLKIAKIKAANAKILELENQKLELVNKKYNSAEAALYSYVGFGEVGQKKMVEARQKEVAAIEQQQAALEQLILMQNAVVGPMPYVPPSTKKVGNNKGGDEAADKVKSVADILAETEKAFARVEAKAGLFGSTFDAQAEKVGVLREAISDLLEIGLKPTDPVLAGLSEQFKDLSGHIQLMPSDLAALAEAEALALDSLEPVLDETKLLNDEFLALGTNLSDVAVVAAERSKEMANSFSAMNMAISTAMQAAGEAMKQSAQEGETSMKAMGKAALKAAADVIRAALMEAVASQIKKAIVSIPFPFNLAIAAAGGAAVGVMFNRLMKGLKIPAFAEGGMVSKPTLGLFGEYPGAKTNPEFVLRQDQLLGLMSKAGGGGNVNVTGTFRIAGRDLVLVLEQAQAERLRLANR